MSAVPLSVRLDGAQSSLDLTKQVSGLVIKSINPGGYASVQCTLQRSIDKSLLAQFTDVLVFDTESGEQVGGGRLMEQGRTANESGQTRQISALGEGLASMQDREEPLFYIDSSLDYWKVSRRTSKRLTAGIGVPGAGSDMEDGLLFEAAEDKSFDINAEALMVNRLAQVTGQNIGGVGVTHREGTTGTGSNFQIRIYPSDLSTAETPLNDTWNVTSPGRQVRVIGTHWTNANPVVGARWIRLGASFTATDNTWARVAKPTIQARMYDRNGALRSGSFYNNEWVLASDVFTDIVSRRAPRLDIANAAIENSGYQFDQLAWVDGITPMGIMDELLATEGAFRWAVWNKQETGKWETEFRSFSTDVRYEASADDGFDGPSPSTDVYNRVVVRGRVESGFPKATVGTSTVPDLDAAGIVRAKTVDMGDEVWSTSQSALRAAQFLNDSKTPPNAGTLTVARKIYDNQTGRWVKPYEIRPGYLIRVRGVQPTPDTLNSSGANGSTIFQVVSNQFSADQGASTLELDAFGLSTVRALAELVRRRARKR